MKLNKTVLVIDDDPHFTHLANAFLSQAVEHVLVENSAAAGLRTALGGGIDLILCDVGMPEMNGFELRRQLAADPALADLPFIFVSAHAGVDAQLSGLRSGAVDYITKPVHRETVVASVLHHLNPKRPLPEAAAIKSPSKAQLSGRLDIIPVPDLLQLLEASRGSGVLALSNRSLVGELHFKDGRIVAARTDEAQELRRDHRDGEDAALALLWLTEGQFSFEKQTIAEPEGAATTWNVSRILLDAAWLHDELERLGDLAPGISDSFVIGDADVARGCFPQSGPWQAIVAANVAAGGSSSIRIDDVAAELGVTTFRVRVAVGGAAEAGGVRIVAPDATD